MIVTGSQMRAKLQALALLITMTEGELEASFKQYPGEDKDPRAVAGRLGRLEAAVARIQVAQMRYNLGVKVKVDGLEITLAEAVKLVGPTSREAKHWRNAIPKKDRYAPTDLQTRGKDEIVQEYTLPRAEIVKLATRAAAKAADLQSAIAIGNATLFDVEGLDEEDLNF